MPNAVRLALVHDRPRPLKAPVVRYLRESDRPAAPRRARLTPAHVIVTLAGAAAAMLLQVLYALATQGAPF